MKAKLKAHRMWANYYPAWSLPSIHLTRSAALAGSAGSVTPVPVAVIALDDCEELIVAAAAAHYKAWAGADYKLSNGDCMRAAFEEIGVLRRAKAKKGRK